MQTCCYMKLNYLLLLAIIPLALQAQGQKQESFFYGTTYYYTATYLNDPSATDYTNYVPLHPNSGIRAISFPPYNGNYNCHAFAWPNDTTVWVQNSDGHTTDAPEYYYNVGYYVPASSESEAEIAVYGGATEPTHSAVRLTNSGNVFGREFLARYPQYAGWWISKWDGGPLVIHRLDSCPFYSPSQPPILYRKYSDAGANHITASSYLVAGVMGQQAVVCASGSQFQLCYYDTYDHDTVRIAAPVSFTVTWGSSSNITISNPNAYPVTATASGTGTGYITATLHFPDGTSGAATQFPVWIGPPASITSISTSQFTPGGNGSTTITVPQYNASFYAWPFNQTDVIYPTNIDSHGANSYWWTCQYETFNQNPGSVGYRYVEGAFSSTGAAVITVHAYNACGSTQDYQSVAVSSSSFAEMYSLSPNPASNTVTISMNKTTEQATPVSSDAAAAKATPVAYTVRVIDILGTTYYTAVKTGNTFTIPVGALKAGNYRVIVSDGTKVSSKPLLIVH